MEDRAAQRLLTIGELSALTGVPVRTIRFYSDTRYDGRALLEPAARTAAGYRLYPIEAAARLELVRTLRDLDIDLPTVARVLAKEVTVAEVARAHADALEAAVKVIRVRQAVLRAVAARDSDWMEMELMHRLAKLDAAERRRILDGYLDRVFEGLDEETAGRGLFERMMRESFPDLPHEATAEQVEAWIELVELVQDESFIARCRQMAAHGAQKRAALSDEKWNRVQAAYAEILAPECEKAYAEGVDPASAAGRERVDAIVARWGERVGVHDLAAGRVQLCDSLDSYLDRRVNRFWELVAVVAGRPSLASQGAPSYESMEWLLKALQAAL
jgi:DNA-binding transcriptional MerR regulator